mgnify:CR=1 FL=1
MQHHSEDSFFVPAFLTLSVLAVLLTPLPAALLLTLGVSDFEGASGFAVIALVAALFGFGGIAAGAVGIAKILFFVFVIMAVVTCVLGLLKKG